MSNRDSRAVVLIDMDSILADISTEWYGRYNQDYNDDLSNERVVTWDTHKFVKPECGEKIYDYLREPGFFLSLKPLPGAQNAVSDLFDLRTHGGKKAYEIYIVTAATAGVETIKEKMMWMEQHFPWINRKHIIACYDKYLVQGDVLVDDGPKNLLQYRQYHPDATLVSIEYPYNRAVADVCDCYAASYQDTEKAWATIYEFLRDPWIW